MSLFLMPNMGIFVSLIFLVIILALFAMPMTIEIAIAKTDIPMQEVAPQFKNNSGSSVPGAQLMKLQAQLKPHDSEGLANLGWYQVKKFGFVASNNSEICPKNNCKYTVENGQFSPSGTGGYIFQGSLKVTAQEGDSKNSKFYKFFAMLDKTGEVETNGKVLQSLQTMGGNTFGFGV